MAEGGPRAKSPWIESRFRSRSLSLTHNLVRKVCNFSGLCASRSGTKTGAARPQLDIEIVRQSDAWDRAKVSDALLSQAAIAAFVAATPRGELNREIAILLTGDDDMRALNLRWRGKDAATNVLSFPGGEDDHLGDVALAFETVEQEAMQRSVAIADHAAHLVVHGMLHLLGYDHETEDEADKMETLETKILATLGIADPYGNSETVGLRKVSP
jgi:probable rRNA maturation factor